MMKLGCNPIPAEKKNKLLRLNNYISTPRFLIHPPTWDWGTVISNPDWGMMGNDTAGDCVFAAIGHMVMIYSALAGKPYVPTTQEVIAAYSKVTGYDPAQTDARGNNPTDNGTDPVDALKWWQKEGFGGNTIGAYVAVDPTNVNHVNAAMYWFGPLLTAINVYQFMEDDFNSGSEWKIPKGWNQNDALGGHGVPLVSFTNWGRVYDLITWGKKTPMSGNCRWGVQVEVFAAIDNAFVTDGKPAPNGFNMQQLADDLRLVQNSGLPAA
jgi:hypothetical protein